MENLKQKVLVELSIEREQNAYMATKGWVKIESPGNFGTFIPLMNEAAIQEIAEGFGIEIQLTGKKKDIIIS